MEKMLIVLCALILLSGCIQLDEDDDEDGDIIDTGEGIPDDTDDAEGDGIDLPNDDYDGIMDDDILDGEDGDGDQNGIADNDDIIIDREDEVDSVPSTY